MYTQIYDDVVMPVGLEHKKVAVLFWFLRSIEIIGVKSAASISGTAVISQSKDVGVDARGHDDLFLRLPGGFWGMGYSLAWSRTLALAGN